jgi:hypothetical protein
MSEIRADITTSIATEAASSVLPVESLRQQIGRQVTAYYAAEQSTAPHLALNVEPDDILDSPPRSRVHDSLFLSKLGRLSHSVAGAIGLTGGILGGTANAGPAWAETANRPVHSSPAQEHIVANPLHLPDGSLAPGPDADAIVTSKHPYNVEVTYTTDRDQKNPKGSAFGLYKTSDLRHVVPDGEVFPAGHEPWWALPSPKGEYWGPALQKIGENYVLYFAADINSAKVHLGVGGRPVTGKVLGVAWGRDIHHMYEHTRILHYIGEDNNVPGNTQHETFGGAIDPTVARDPETGTLYIAYCEQPNRIMLSTLSPNGLVMSKQVRMISYANLPWETGVEEGPVLFWNDQLNAMGMTVNTASTWKGNYKQAYEVSFDLSKGWFRKADQPIEESGNGLHGPGMGSQPFLGPDGKSWFVYLHVQERPNHNEMDRYLALEPWHWSSSKSMLVPASAVKTLPSNSQSQDLPKNAKVEIPVPAIGTGQTNHHVVTPFLVMGTENGQILKPAASGTRQ